MCACVRAVRVYACARITSLGNLSPRAHVSSLLSIDSLSQVHDVALLTSLQTAVLSTPSRLLTLLQTAVLSMPSLSVFVESLTHARCKQTTASPSRLMKVRLLPTPIQPTPRQLSHAVSHAVLLPRVICGTGSSFFCDTANKENRM
jgi:hypothetical protein